MTQEEVITYIDAADRLAWLLAHSGVDWKPEFETEKDKLRKIISSYRKKIEAEKKRRGMK